MAVEIKNVSYSYNSLLEEQGREAYFLDVIVCRDKESIVDIHKSFKSREELFEAMEDVLPVLEDAAIAEVECNEDWEG